MMTKWRNVLVGGAAVAAGGAVAWYARERNTPEPDYRSLRLDKQFELRDYPAVWVAAVEHTGARRKSLNRAYERLSDYTEAKDRAAQENDTAKLSMVVPVLQDATGEGAWRLRFIMPISRTDESLPQPPADIRLEELPARRIAAIRFSGAPKMKDLRRREDELRRWLEREQLQPISGFEYAFYNSPMIPPFLRRNEVWVPVSAE
jgi:DNA gyrase inhibitor GyrI